MEVNKLWKNNDINKYYIISLDKETNEWKFFREIIGHTVFWKDKPSRYGMTKSKAIEVLNIVKNLTKIESETSDSTLTESENPTTPTEPESESGTGETTPTEPSGEDNGENTPTDSTDAPTEPSEGNTDTPTDTDGETSTGENESEKTPSEGNTEPSTPTTEEPQYKIIAISSVTYNSEEVPIFDDTDYHKLKTTLTYLDTTYPNENVSVAVVEDDARKTIFYFYLDEELTWFLELRTNIDYALVNNVTTLDDIKELL